MTEIGICLSSYYACFSCFHNDIGFAQSKRILLWKDSYSHDIPFTQELAAQAQQVHNLMKAQNPFCGYFCCIPCVSLGYHNNHAFFELMELTKTSNNLRVNSCCMIVNLAEISDSQSVLLPPSMVSKRDRNTVVEINRTQVTFNSTLSMKEIEEVNKILNVYRQTYTFIYFTRLLAENSLTRFTFIEGQKGRVTKVYYYAFSYPRLPITQETFQMNPITPTIINPMSMEIEVPIAIPINENDMIK